MVVEYRMREDRCTVCLRQFLQPRVGGRPRTTCGPICKREYNRRHALNHARRRRGQPIPLYPDHEARRKMQNLTAWHTALPVEEIIQIQLRLRHGWTREQLAEIYGISPSTVGVYRGITDIRPVQVGGWQAVFGIRRGRPAQLGPWQKDDA